MTTTATAIVRGLFKKTLACTRCGSDNVFPAPGPFGALASFIGLERHLCRPCGRPFWARTSAEYTHPERPEERAGDDLGELLAGAPEDEDTPDLDMSGPEPEPVDLAALDAEFERRCAEYRKSEQRPEVRTAAPEAPEAETEPTAAER